MIKNLLFDLGGVIVDIERQRCVDAFARLGLADADSVSCAKSSPPVSPIIR